MAFFPVFSHPFHTNEFNFISNLLDDISSPFALYSDSSSRSAFSPKFDIRETEKDYVLEGELPGLSDKSNVHIEATDAQTILVKGKIKRSYSSVSEDRKQIEDGGRQSVTDSGEPFPKRLKPTVEEDSNEGNKSESSEARKTAEGELVGKKVEVRDTRPKYWISERKVGKFQRKFSFPESVDPETVTASLKHGVLKIVVPKRKQLSGRRIEIQ